MSVAIIINPLSGGASPSKGRRRAELAADALAKAGEHGDIFVFVIGLHRSFNVANPRSAKTKERIQNLTITVFSFQPLSSK